VASKLKWVDQDLLARLKQKYFEKYLKKQKKSSWKIMCQSIHHLFQQQIF
jgi:hypothetical protein